MAFMKKDELEKWAVDLGMDLTGMSWQEKNKAVQAALRDMGYSIGKTGNVVEPEAPSQEAAELMEKVANLEELVSNLTKVISNMPARDGVKEAPEMALNPGLDEQPELPAGRIILSPCIAPTKIQLVKYDEVLGNDLEVEEAYYDLDKLRMELDGVSGSKTYKVKGRKKNKVVAQSTIPKENAGVTFTARTDWFPVIEDPMSHRKGYPWKHHVYHSVYDMLRETGKYSKYKDLFNASENPQNVWYAAGKIICCDIDLVHTIMREIQEDAR